MDFSKKSVKLVAFKNMKILDYLFIIHTS